MVHLGSRYFHRLNLLLYLHHHEVGLPCCIAPCVSFWWFGPGFSSIDRLLCSALLRQRIRYNFLFVRNKSLGLGSNLKKESLITIVLNSFACWTTLGFLGRYNSAAPSYYTTTTTYAPAPVSYSPPVYTAQASSYYQTEASVNYKKTELSSIYQYASKYAEPSYYASAQSYYTVASPSK